MNLLRVATTITIISITYISYGTATSETLCNEIEKQSLLRFKTGLLDPSERLGSWDGREDCCNWAGVVCHHLTGHVLELHLGGNLTYQEDDQVYYYTFYEDYAAYPRFCLGGNISNSLVNLRHLRYLDLSNNDFGGRRIPEFFGSMQSLRFLNLSSSGFGGMVPPQLGNLSNLLYLNIGRQEYLSYVENLHWLSGLSRLKHLNMNYINLTHTFSWTQQVSALPSLKELHLLGCHLSDFPQLPLLGAVQNLTSLRHLDLSFNYFNSSMPDWIYNLSQLEKLILTGNEDLHGVLPDAMGNLTSLTHLDVSYTNFQLDVKGSSRTLCNLQLLDLSGINLRHELTHLFETVLRCSSNCRLQDLSLFLCGFSGSIPESIGSLASLKYLDLSDNQLKGTIPASVGKLFQLEHLDLGGNSLQGTLPEALFSNLTRLEYLVASDNQISWRESPNWVPPFQLIWLDLSSWQLGPEFPEWLRTQYRLTHLELTSTGIKDQVPTWLWNQSSQFVRISLARNNLYGDIPEVILSAQNMDLSFNNFTGLLPSLSREVIAIDFSYNRFSGPISQLLCHNKDEPKKLIVMVLGNNQLSQEIPDCWAGWQALKWVDMQKNVLTGNIPGSMGSLRKLVQLSLNNNSLSGVVPRFIQNWSSLKALDLSHNLLSGPVLQLLCNDRSMPGIRVLMLGNNRISGDIPDCWESWPYLERLELQENELTGHLPDSIGSLKQLVTMHLQNNKLSGKLPSSWQNSTSLEIFDIGENKFGGSLPKWIGESFVYVRIMRLRSNDFIGMIPNTSCGLQSLQTLDIANNNLSGYIPKCIFNLGGMANGTGTGEPLGNYSLSIDYHLPSFFDSREDRADLVTKGSSREYISILQYTVFLDLSNNSLSGHIPEEITNLVALISLNLSSNMLSGRIPKHMGNMSSLESLDLSFNRLSGEIPPSMAAMTALSFLNLSYNNLTGTIPTSTQLSTFGPSSFLGNNLNVSNNSSRNGSSLADHDDQGFEFNEMYVSAVLGFVVGFGIVVAPLLYSHYWRLVYFRTIGCILDRVWELFVLPVRVRFRRQI